MHRTFKIQKTSHGKKVGIARSAFSNNHRINTEIKKIGHPEISTCLWVKHHLLFWFWILVFQDRVCRCGPGNRPVPVFLVLEPKAWATTTCLKHHILKWLVNQGIKEKKSERKFWAEQKQVHRLLKCVGCQWRSSLTEWRSLPEKLAQSHYFDFYLKKLINEI